MQVSVLPFLSKVVARAGFTQVLEFLSQHNLLDSNQSGLKSSHSAPTALSHQFSSCPDLLAVFDMDIPAHRAVIQSGMAGRTVQASHSFHWGTARISAWSPSLLNILYITSLLLTTAMLMIPSSICPSRQTTQPSWHRSQPASVLLQNGWWNATFTSIALRLNSWRSLPVLLFGTLGSSH